MVTLEAAIEAVKDHPASTAAELAQASGLDEDRLRQRLTEARAAGLVRYDERRRCRVSGKRMETWMLCDGQREMFD
jgi:hypothetical protein